MMKRPYLNYPDKCLFSQVAIEHKNPMGTIHPEIEHRIEVNMQQALAEFISHSSAESIEHEFHKEYRLQLYVFTPAQFHEMIHNEVQRQLDITRYLEVVKP